MDQGRKLQNEKAEFSFLDATFAVTHSIILPSIIKLFQMVTEL